MGKINGLSNSCIYYERYKGCFYGGDYARCLKMYFQEQECEVYESYWDIMFPYELVFENDKF